MEKRGFSERNCYLKCFKCLNGVGGGGRWGGDIAVHPRADRVVHFSVIDLFVYFARVSFYLFSLPFDVRDWLWFVILALPGLFY